MSENVLVEQLEHKIIDLAKEARTHTENSFAYEGYMLALTDVLSTIHKQAKVVEK